MKKKLLFIIISLDGGGAEKVLIDILRNFDYSKYTIDLCLISRGGVYISEVPSHVKIIPLFHNDEGLIAKIEHRIYRHFRFTLLESFRIRRKVARNYDSIISFLEGEPLKYHSYITSRASKNITWVHSDLLENYKTVGFSLSTKHEVNAYKKMDEIIFVSNDAMNQFKQRFTLNVNQRVVYNIIDKKAIIETSNIEIVEKKKFTVCTIGRLCEQKAFDRFIRVAKMAKNEGYDFDFWILGEGSLKEELMRLRDDLGLHKNVHFLGFKKPSYAWLKQADIFVCTSIAEGFSLVVCEALCLGKPIVATKCTGPIEILDQNKYGILTEHDDESIFQGIKMLVENVDLLKQYQKMAIERANIFNVQKTMQEIYSVL